ncbi:sialate O-acetylesterase, partial [Escherichia coli]|nr:sialate O-acetylesterase [Escherichia coli]
ENWTTALRSSHFSAAARRGIISDSFVEAILQFLREK